MNYKMSLRPLVAGLALASLFNVAQAAPTSASMALNAAVQVGNTSASDPQTAHASGSLTSLAVGSSSSIGDVQAYGSGTATWSADGNAGTVHLVQGWKFPVTGGAANFINGETPVWEYRFTADHAGTLQLNYNVTTQGDPFGLQGWSFGWSGVEGGLYLYDASNPSASGSFTRDVAAGESYSLSILTYSNISGGSTRDASMDGTFHFAITPGSVSPVPEPEAPAMFAMGAAAVAFAARRKGAKKKA